MQAWLQPMQARMSSSRPAAVLAGSSGSQISARVMTHSVGLAGGEDRLGLLRLADPPGDEHRDADDRLRPGGERRRVAVRPRRRRHDVVRARQRRGRPGDHAHVVHRPVGVEGRERRERLVLGQAVGRHLADRDPQPDHEPGPRRGPAAASASRRNRSRRVRVAAVLVGPQVRARVEELRRAGSRARRRPRSRRARPAPGAPPTPRTRRRSRGSAAPASRAA